MPPFGPISRRKLIRALTDAGFEGPFPAGRHPVMVRRGLSLQIPNPHGEDIGVELLKRILKQAGISKSEWENL
jgi:predicted RNA binding protein YcfA (HicA-like mRNA interferase family)